MIDRELNPYKGDLGTAWDENSFGIYVKDKNGKKLLKELYKSILDGDIAIWLGGGGVFQNAGLNIGLVDRLPEEGLQTLFDADKKNYETKVAGEKTGIYKVLEKSEKRYYACSPCFQEDGSVMFWLNPHEQQKYNSGWFTVEQLKQWANDKGPIIKVGNGN